MTCCSLCPSYLVISLLRFLGATRRPCCRKSFVIFMVYLLSVLIFLKAIPLSKPAQGAGLRQGSRVYGIRALSCSGNCALLSGGQARQGVNNEPKASRRGRVFHARFMHEIPCKSFDSGRLRLTLVSFATRASHGLCINTVEVLMAVRLCLDYFLIILDSHSWAGGPRASSCIPHIIALWRRSAHTNICRDSLNNLFQELLLPLRVAQ